MSGVRKSSFGGWRVAGLLANFLAVALMIGGQANAQSAAGGAKTTVKRPKLVVMLVVDQMRADYVDKFQGQWTGGLQRLVREGAWFREAAYPYAATETCVGHATIATGALPATHGMVANTWWDRDSGRVVTWFENGFWTTSTAFGSMPFVESFAKAHPVAADWGKTWSLSLPESSYLYDEKAAGAAAPGGWELMFPHPLRGKPDSSGPDAAFYLQWATSPYADTYLTKMAEDAVDQLGLGKSDGTDFLGVSYSSVDYVGHAFGPRSWEIQDVLVRLDKDLDELFQHLDRKVGRGNYVVAFSADHGVVPIPADMKTTGVDAGVLNLVELKDKIERALGPFNYPDPSVA